MFSVLGVIPARGGSKGIPKKNIVDLCGRPLIAYTIEAAIGSARLTDHVVSTDSEEIAEVARREGGIVPFIRPAELSDDKAGSLGVVQHALFAMEERRGSQYDAVVLLQPTTPLRPSAMIDEAIAQLEMSDADSVVSLVDVGAVHPHRMYTIQNRLLKSYTDGIPDPMAPRQALPPVYIRSGDIYCARRETVLAQKSLIGERSLALVVPPDRAVNIDGYVDLLLAREKICGDSGVG